MSKNDLRKELIECLIRVRKDLNLTDFILSHELDTAANASQNMLNHIAYVDLSNVDAVADKIGETILFAAFGDRRMDFTIVTKVFHFCHIAGQEIAHMMAVHCILSESKPSLFHSIKKVIKWL